MSQANHCWVVSEEYVRSIVDPILFANLESYLNEHSIEWQVFAESARWSFGDLEFEFSLPEYTPTEFKKVDVQAIIDKVEAAYTLIRQAFEARTGLPIFIGYHHAQNRSDDIDGVFWEVGNVQDFTPAARAILDHIEEAYYVTED